MSTIKLNLSGHENKYLDEMGYMYPGALHVELNDPDLPEKIINYLTPLMNSGDVVELSPPGLAPLSIMVITAIHGITGNFPTIQPLIKDNEKGFVPGQKFNLQDYRNNVARLTRKDVVVL